MKTMKEMLTWYPGWIILCDVRFEDGTFLEKASVLILSEDEGVTARALNDYDIVIQHGRFVKNRFLKDASIPVSSKGALSDPERVQAAFNKKADAFTITPEQAAERVHTLFPELVPEEEQRECTCGHERFTVGVDTSELVSIHDAQTDVYLVLTQDEVAELMDKLSWALDSAFALNERIPF